MKGFWEKEVKNAFIKKARAIILFGSMARWDWHKESDIDLFIFGDHDGLDIGRFEIGLGREIQLFFCKEAKDLERYSQGFLKNILHGYILKGSLDFLKVEPNVCSADHQRCDGFRKKGIMPITVLD